MPELKFDEPVPELTEQEDEQTIAAIAEGVEQLDAGRGIPLEELRKEFVRRCSK
jgi:predicted transcriptional regulator